MAKKILVTVSEPNMIIGSPDYGRAETKVEIEGLTTQQCVLILSSILQQKVFEYAKEFEAAQSEILALKTPILKKI